MKDTQLTEFLQKLDQHTQGDAYGDQLYRQLYATDASNYQVRPIAVLCPSSVDDVQTAAKLCTEFEIPLISRGGGSSLSGQSIGKGLVVDYTKHLNKVIDVDWDAQWVEVQAGITLHNLNKFLLQHGLMIGPDPSSALAATIGGMAGNNTTGTHSIVYGMMVDQVQAVEVILIDGTRLRFEEKSAEQLSSLIQQDDVEGHLYRGVLEILKKYRREIKEDYPKTWRNVAGYNLNRLQQTYQENGRLNLASLIVGSEGTLGSIVQVRLKTVQKPKATRLAMVHFDALSQACEAVAPLLETNPTAVELTNDYFHEIVADNAAFRPIQSQFIRGIPAAVLMVEYSAESSEALDPQIDGLHSKLTEIGYKGEVVIRTTPEEIAAVWQMRKAAFGLMMSKRGDDKPLAFADDATVPVKNLSAFLKDMNEIFEEEGIRVVQAGHASAGCVHINPNINLKTQEGLAQMRKLSEATAETALKYGGTSTGEHGEGLARSFYNAQLYGASLHQAFREVKYLFDPQNLMQPGRIVNPSEPWNPTLLRFQPGYETPFAPRETVLDFSQDGGFSGLVEMCNGMGFCRKDDGGVMCPSYRVTRDERHATRGRANALRAAIKGELKEGLSDQFLYETLDLCLECKACKIECPSLVDMAKLKYEYLSQYQAKHGVPLKHKLFAHIHAINRKASTFRSLANFSFGHKGFRKMLEKLTGIDTRRTIPAIAKENFQQWFEQRKRTEIGEKGEVILWDDTYLSYNEPEIGKAAVKVLEAIGFKVRLISKRVCCGRPMVSKGVLKQAQQHAQINVELLLPFVQKGVPILGLEPSCISTFKDEYPDLLQNEASKLVAKQAYFFEDFLMELYQEGKLDLPFKTDLSPQKILFHAHCYQKALGKPRNTLNLLKLIPSTTVEEIPSGCCGMAGSFGYEKHHYDLSMACGEEVLFPKVRSSKQDTIIAAAGISCRHQILEGTYREAKHPIVLLAEAIGE